MDLSNQDTNGQPAWDPLITDVVQKLKTHVTISSWPPSQKFRLANKPPHPEPEDVPTIRMRWLMLKTISAPTGDRTSNPSEFSTFSGMNSVSAEPDP